jgi:glutaredoxin
MTAGCMILLSNVCYCAPGQSALQQTSALKSQKYQLVLYYRPTCPYCIKVLNFLAKNCITIPLKNISEDSKAREMLLQNGGKTQVPCLSINNKFMYDQTTS